jgi:electron transport complex protein RnfD
VPVYVVIVAAGVSMIVAKHLFGGLGCNIWNPALAGRAFVQVAYPAAITLSSWPILRGHGPTRFFGDIRKAAPESVDAAAYDAISRATPLAHNAIASLAPDRSGLVHAQYGSLADLFIGTIPGCLGETSALLILLGGLFLIYKGYVNWRAPAVFLGTLFLITLLVPSAKIPGAHVPGGLPQYTGAPGWWYFPTYELLAGGAMLGAFFMATDTVTTPITSGGQVVFALGCGIITGAIRLAGHGFPEGVCYAILLMNTAVPVIDRYTRQRKYGAAKGGAR